MTSAVVYAPFPDASARYRLIEPARALGVPVVDRLAACDEADMIVLNRPFGATGHPSGNIADRVEQWAAEGRRVVVDMDDDFDALEADHAIVRRVDTEGLHRACKAAATVVCTTPALEQRYGYGHGVVVPNMIPERYTALEQIPYGRVPMVGWYGALGAHPRDLDVTGATIGSVLDARGARFMFAGPPSDAPRVEASLGVGYVTRLGTYNLEGLLSAVAQFDVGIVPLQRNPFNAAKSWLKGLEMAAVGVPVIASPTPEYERMAADGGCVLARTPGEWARMLDLHLSSPEAREGRRELGRAFAARWSIERNTEVWSRAWYGA